MTSERLPVVSTRMNHRILDQRLKGIQKGLGLLKCKGDALQIKTREIENELKNKEDNAKLSFKRAFKMLSKIDFYGTDIRPFSKACMETCLSVKCEFHNLDQ